MQVNYNKWGTRGCMRQLFDFSLNVLAEFAEFSDKKILVIKRVPTCHLFCKRPKMLPQYHQDIGSREDL